MESLIIATLYNFFFQTLLQWKCLTHWIFRCFFINAGNPILFLGRDCAKKHPGVQLSTETGNYEKGINLLNFRAKILLEFWPKLIRKSFILGHYKWKSFVQYTFSWGWVFRQKWPRTTPFLTKKKQKESCQAFKQGERR